MKHSNYEKEIRNTVQYLKLYYVSSLSGNTRSIISLATSSISTKIYQSLAKSSEKIKSKNSNCRYFNKTSRVWQSHSPRISCAPNPLRNHAVSADQNFSSAASLRKKHHPSFWFLFWLPNRLLKYNTVKMQSWNLYSRFSNSLFLFSNH